MTRGREPVERALPRRALPWWWLSIWANRLHLGRLRDWAAERWYVYVVD